MVQQSLAILILLSALAGFVTMVARAMVVRKIRIKKQQDGKISKLHEQAVFYGFFIIEGLRSASLYLSTWFGPVSLSFVIYNAVKLLFNILFIGVLLKHETFNKETQVATAVIILSVILITFLGPSTQDNQDPKELILGSPIAMIWLGFVGMITIVSSYMMLCTKIKNRRPWVIDTVFLTVASGCHVLAGTISRVAGIEENDLYRWLLMGLVGILAIIVAIEIYRQASHVSSLAKFIPRVLVGSVSGNAITGLLVWEEGKVIFSWVGYVAAYLVMFLGIYLMSNLDFFVKHADEVQEYHRQELEAFFGELEARLERAEEESKMNRHQIRIMDASREIGLKRGRSDPEICSTFSSSRVSCERNSELPTKHSTTASTKEIAPFSGLYINGSASLSKNNKRFHLTDNNNNNNKKHNSRSLPSCNSSVSSIGSSHRSALSESIHEIKKHFLEPDDGLSTSERMKKVATTLRRSSLESCGTENTPSADFLSTSSERLRTKAATTTLRRSSFESASCDGGTENTASDGGLSSSERNNRKLVKFSRSNSLEEESSSSCGGTEDNTEDNKIFSTNNKTDTEEEEYNDEIHSINYRSTSLDGCCAVSILDSIDGLSDIESFGDDLQSSSMDLESSFEDVELGASLSDCSSISC